MWRLPGGWRALWRLLSIFWMISSDLLRCAWTLSPSELHQVIICLLLLSPPSGEQPPQHLSTGKTTSTGQTPKTWLCLIPLITTSWIIPEQRERRAMTFITVIATSGRSFPTKHSCQADTQQSLDSFSRSKTHLKLKDVLLPKFPNFSWAITRLSAISVTLQPAPPSCPTTLIWRITPHLTCLKENPHLPSLPYQALRIGPSLLWDFTNSDTCLRTFLRQTLKNPSSVLIYTFKTFCLESVCLVPIFSLRHIIKYKGKYFVSSVLR